MQTHTHTPSAAMEKVTEWLSLSEKRVTMYFSNIPNQSERSNISVGGQMIKNVEEYLGVIVDYSLNFKKKTCHVLKCDITNFGHIRNSLSTEAAELNGRILFHILYCISSWSQANKTALNPIISL